MKKIKSLKNRILILTWRDLIGNDDYGGNEVYIDRIATGLTQKGYSTTVFSSLGENQSRDEVVKGVKYIRRGSRYTVYFWAAYYYFRYLRNSIDFIIDVENGIPFFTPMYSNKAKVSLVHHFHNGQWFKEFSFPIAIVGYYIERKVMPFIYKNTRFITVSNSSKLDLEYLGIEPDNVTIAYNGTSFDGVQRPSRKVLYKDPTILYLGRLREYKRIDLAMKAVRSIKKDIPNIKLIIAGKGDDEVRLRSIAKVYKIEDNVEFLGFVSDEKKCELLSKSWVYVNPSSKEGWGIVNIEANYYGTPVVGFNVFGVRDSVLDGYSGYLAETYSDFENKLQSLLESKKVVKMFKNNCIEWANRYNWKNTIDVFDQEINCQMGFPLVNSKSKVKVKKFVTVDTGRVL